MTHYFDCPYTATHGAGLFLLSEQAIAEIYERCAGDAAGSAVGALAQTAFVTNNTNIL
jgi:hypothetical protein